MKIIVFFYCLFLPFIVFCQPNSTCLVGQTNIILHKGEIIYAIPNKTIERLEPVIFPEHYKIAYKTDNTPCQSYFVNKEALEEYLQNSTSNEFRNNDLLLFLKAVALYKIWQSIDIVESRIDIDNRLRELTHVKDKEVAQIAKTILLIH